ncbi:MAG: hypothetical protein WAL38_04100 [Solirubrobacteraceae bacterium]
MTSARMAGSPARDALPVGLLEGGRDHMLRDGVARPALAARVQERRLRPTTRAVGLSAGETDAKSGFTEPAPIAWSADEEFFPFEDEGLAAALPDA